MENDKTMSGELLNDSALTSDGQKNAIVVVKNVYSSNEKVELHVPLGTTVLELKSILLRSGKFPDLDNAALANQRLIYCGKLCKDESTLGHLFSMMDIKGPQTFHLLTASRQKHSLKDPKSGVEMPDYSDTSNGVQSSDETDESLQTPSELESSAILPLQHPTNPVQSISSNAMCGTEPSSSELHYLMEEVKRQERVLANLNQLVQSTQHPDSTLIWRAAALQQMTWVSWTTYYVQQQAFYQAALVRYVLAGASNFPTATPGYTTADTRSGNIEDTSEQRENTTVTRSFRFSAYMDFKLFIKLAFMVFLLCQDGDPQRILTLSTIAFILYIHQTGLLAPLRDRLFGQLAQQTSTWRAFREYTTLPSQHGFLRDVQSLILGFVCSLLPSWSPSLRA